MKVPTSIARTVGKTVLKAKTNSPTIFFGLGIAGVVGGTVLACRSTMNLAEVLDETHERLESAKAVQKKNAGASTALVKQSNRDVAKAYADGVIRVGRLYAPAVIVTSAGLACLTGSHVILTRRNAAIGAAYAAVSKSYDEYRGRVREEIGEEQELALYRKVEWADVEGSDGMIQEPASAKGSWGNPYGRFFDETNPNWRNNRDMNMFFLECQERYYNHVLQQRGHVFLNEVYQNIGIPHSPEGQVVGWFLDPNTDDYDSGDNYIDFGVYEAVNAEKDNSDPCIVLDFNVDGYILGKIKG